MKRRKPSPHLQADDEGDLISLLSCRDLTQRFTDIFLIHGNKRGVDGPDFLGLGMTLTVGPIDAFMEMGAGATDTGP